MGRISLCRRGGARKAKKDTDEGGRCGAGPAPTRGDNPMQRIHFCGNGTPASKGGGEVTNLETCPNVDEGAPAS
ncbi:hypothetical protein Y032_0075g942 [Ancylostoma ceylanicum]|uniref:Uncharacterized protein n=1 Tax=Ancylostoma ceylanicum TaxID=53326 RepID=A0A016TUX9_9BILA|nr:hypothetical protein Y032_0075g942 [Ancylostoma ceylanicum]